MTVILKILIRIYLIFMKKLLVENYQSFLKKSLIIIINNKEDRNVMFVLR